MAYNEGPDGLPKLDYVLSKASELGIKIARRFTTAAPACRAARPSNRAPSPFVRAEHHGETEPVALGWGSSSE